MTVESKPEEAPFEIYTLAHVSRMGGQTANTLGELARGLEPELEPVGQLVVDGRGIVEAGLLQRNVGRRRLPLHGRLPAGRLDLQLGAELVADGQGKATCLEGP